MEKEFLSNMIITDIISASTIYTEKGSKVKRRRRSAWAVVLKYEGETVYYQNNKKLISNACNILLLPKDSDYEWFCTNSGHCIIIDFECTASSNELLTFKTTLPDLILKMFRKIEFCLTMRNEMYKQTAIKYLYEIIISLSKEKETGYSNRSKQLKITPAIEYIAKNYHKQIKNDELAKICGLSTVYFRKLFSESLGISPINYIHQLRINKAKEMFASDYTSITEIALSLGYSDIYDFSRVFKKITGLSPSKYQKYDELSN